MRASLTERFGAELEFQFEVDAALIGGVPARGGPGDRWHRGRQAGRTARSFGGRQAQNHGEP